MDAIVIRRFGDPSHLEATRLPIPEPRAGEVRVRVEAVGVNPLDLQTRRGDYADLVRLPLVLGSDASGVIDAVGPGAVDGWHVGDEVFYMPPLLAGQGTYARYHVTPAATLQTKPSRLTHAEAAALPLAAGTAWQCLFDRGRLQPGHRVLVHAGAGGVGSFAVQLAAIAGATVFATCRPDNDSFVRSLGADETIDYRDVDFVDAIKERTCGRGVDVVIDTVGGRTFQRSIEALADGGRLVSIVDHDEPHNLLRAWERNAEIHFVFTSPSADRLARIASLAEAGRLRPVIADEFPLLEAVEAHRRIEAGGVCGKIVLVPEPTA